MMRPYFKYLLALLLFGSNDIVANHIGLTSYQIVLLRSALGSLLLTGIFFLSGHKPTAMRHKKDALFIILSGLAMAADWLFLFEAYAHIGVSLGMLINYFGPAIVMALSPLVFKERLRSPKISALIAALVGVSLISGQAALGGVNTWGFICAGLSAVCYAAMVMLNKMSKQVTGLENATLQLFSALIAAAIFVGGKHGFSMDIAAGSWLPILWIGLFNTGGGCYFYFSSIGKLPVQTVAICGYLEPLSAVALSTIILHERMLPLQILGAVLIIGGAAFGECLQQRNPS